MAEQTVHSPVAIEHKTADAHMRAIEEAERTFELAFQTGKADRAEITRKARDAALDAVDLVEEAMEADAEADEADRMAIIVRFSNNDNKIKLAKQRARDARKEAKEAHKLATKRAKDAYDAVKFSTPGKLGFMRVVQIVFAANIAATLLSLLMTSRDVIVYDSTTIMTWIEIILEGIAFWFFVNYYKIARPFVIGTAAFCVVVPTIVSIAAGNFSLFLFLTSSAWHIFLILYFTFSKRVKAVLVNDLSNLTPEMVGTNSAVNRRGWPFVRNLIIYFVVFSVLGHWMEAAMCQLIRLGLVKGEYDPSNTMLWRDWLYPFPMEGVAVVIIALVLYPLWQKLLIKYSDRVHLAYIISFCVNALTCGAIEFLMGLIVNADHQLWDYRNMTFNILGQVCLQNMLAFGVAASLMAWIVYPQMEKWIARIPYAAMNIIFIVVAITGGILWSLYIIDPPKQPTGTTPTTVPTRKTIIDETARTLSFNAISLLVRADQMEVLLERTTNLNEEQRAQLQEEIENLRRSAEAISELLENA